MGDCNNSGCSGGRAIKAILHKMEVQQFLVDTVNPRNRGELCKGRPQAGRGPVSYYEGSHVGRPRVTSGSGCMALYTIAIAKDIKAT